MRVMAATKDTLAMVAEPSVFPDEDRSSYRVVQAVDQRAVGVVFKVRAAFVNVLDN